jgi:ATP-dependent helicase/nuclease subunit B
VTLTYPEFDARGDRNLPSMFLESIGAPHDRSRAVRPMPRRMPRAAANAAIEDSRLLEYVRQRTALVSPSKLESFLQCPYQYFAGGLLRLRPAPPRPELRLNKNYLRQGEIVHLTLARWWQQGGDISAVFEAVFAEVAAKEHIQVSYQSERARNAMLDDLRKFAAADEWDRSAYIESRTEQDFEFPLTESVSIRGKIDRLDVTADGRAVVIDYKYSNAQNTKAKLENENLLQAPLYLMAAERQFGLVPSAMYYLGLKAAVEYAEWSAADGWRERTIEKTLRVVEEIRGGRIAVAPFDADKCRFCDAKDVCRVEVGAAAAVGAPA